MSISTMALLAALTLWVLLESKTSRSDGKLVRTHPYRRMMHFIMPSRGASVVYYESLVPAETAHRSCSACLPSARTASPPSRASPAP